MDAGQDSIIRAMMDYDGHYALDDHHLCDLLRKIINTHGINLVIETGTNVGLSTVKLCEMGAPVISIDIDPNCTAIARERLLASGVKNYHLVTAESTATLAGLAPAIHVFRTLIFLDAHMGTDTKWPIFDELAAIPKRTGILVLHDIKVPGKDFAYAPFVLPSGEQVDFEYAHLRDALTAWSPTHRLEYNEEAGGDRVGVAVVYP